MLVCGLSGNPWVAGQLATRLASEGAVLELSKAPPEDAAALRKECERFLELKVAMGDYDAAELSLQGTMLRKDPASARDWVDDRAHSRPKSWCINSNCPEDAPFPRRLSSRAGSLASTRAAR